MRCVMDKARVKIFARALHSLAKIGGDLHMSGTSDGLVCSTYNSARSAFLYYTFRIGFFTEYDEQPVDSNGETQTQTQGSVVNGDGDGKAECKVAMKGAIWVFKVISQLEKTVETAEIALLPIESRLRVRMECKYSVSKTYSLPFLDCDPVAANYDPSAAKNSFTARAKVLSEAVLNFLSSQEEVTMIAEEDRFVIKNYVDVYDVKNADGEVGGGKGAVHTVLTMQPDTDFERYVINEPSQGGVTFCLQELRAFLSFADACALAMTASFDDGGTPIIFTVKCPESFDASLVMSTLSDGNAMDAVRAADTTATEAARTSTQVRRQQQQQQQQKESTQQRPTPTRPATPSATPIRPPPAFSGTPPAASATPPAAFATPPLPMASVNGAGDNVVGDSSAVMDSTLPPAAKKRRLTDSLFRRCFDNTYNPNDETAAQRVLAPDSDEET